ncbi:MAG: WbuC family cupin fold metalloprotein [Sulfuritalea sp.]|nr:WbuC family cupin fold metalloprotein [Sulfuritalea sp.]MBK9351889.1 WbuC family cupin fold metalloprotein [Sulfuritalea sp.]MBP6636756.1 WbuC family cupin fold metalloprotein [Sulfuritalea sp.]
MITLIDDALLDAVCAEAAASPRRRKNRNFHPRDDHPGHRLLNALMADTYIPPHRHLDPNKDETYVVLRGRLGLVEFDDAGAVMRTLKVGAGGAAIGVDVAHGTWHTAVALEDETVFLEAKAGPYLPLTAEEKAPWAPAENSPEAAAYLAKMKVLF